MIDNISRIGIKGEFFSNTIEWDISTNNNERLILIYGNNGSGKTTFSKAIYEYKTSVNGTFKNFEEIYFKDKYGNLLNNLNKNNIWSFNDEFIQKNIRIKNSGIDAIIMFGEAIDVDEKIDECNKKLKKINEHKELIDLNKYITPKNPSCIDDAYSLILDCLKKEWAINDKLIKGNARNSSVNDSTIDKIISTTKCKDSISTLKSKFDEKLSLYNSLPKEALIINDRLCLDNKLSNDNYIIDLLKKEINKPIFGELENKIIDELNKKDNFVDLNNTKIVLNNSKICPLCFQSLNEDHRHLIIDAINKIFDEEANNHLNELKSIILNKISSYDFSPFLDIIDNDTKNNINKIVDEINKDIETYTKEICNKEKNVFIPIFINDLKMNEKLNLLENQIKKANKLIDDYNDNILNIDKLKKELILINEQIAFCTIKPLFDKYKNLTNNKSKDENTILDYENEINRIKNKIDELNAKKKNFNLGLQEINDDLQLIFHTRSRLQLVLNDGKYYVKSNGRIIQFNNLSVGEKNVIGLCYFFSLIRNGHSKKDVFSDEMLIVLDDPISSFDFSNKYGIYSYLKKMFMEIFKKNKLTKAIVLTHELETLLNLDKIKGELNFSSIKFKIENQKLIENKFKESIYKNMLIEMVDLVDDNLDSATKIITSENINTTRRVLEAFCSFTYNKKYCCVLNDKDIMSIIENEKLKNYFLVFANRIVLNNESHTEEMIQCFPENMCYDVFSQEEKRQVIKDTLIFIYSLNKIHIKKILKEKSNIVEKIYAEVINELNENVTM